MAELIFDSEVRAVGEIDWENSLSKYLKVSLLPNQGIGDVLTELVSGVDIAMPLPITWNVDGSVTSTDDNFTTKNLTRTVNTTDEVIMVLSASRLGADSQGEDIILSLNGGSSYYISILRGRYGAGWKITIKNGSTQISTNYLTNVETNDILALHWKSNSSYDLYFRSNLIASDVAVVQVTSGTYSSVTLGIGSDKTNFYSSQILTKTGSFTNEEVNEIVTNPYQLFKRAETVQQEYGLNLLTATQQISFPLVGLWTGTLTYSDGTTSAESGTDTFVIDGTIAKFIAKFTATDTVNSYYFELNQTFGNQVKCHYTGVIATLSGFSADSGYMRGYGVKEGLNLTVVGESISLPLSGAYDINLTEFNGTITNYVGSGTFTLDGTTPIKIVSISGFDATYTSLFYDFTAITSNTVVPETLNGNDGTLVGFTDVFVPETNKTLVSGSEATGDAIYSYSGYGEIVGYQFTATTYATLVLTGAYTGTINYVDGTSLAISDVIDGLGDYVVNTGIVASITATDTVGSYAWDGTTGNGGSLIDTLSNNHAIITNTSTEKWQPIVPVDVYTVGDYADLQLLNSGENADLINAKEYLLNGASVGGTVSGFTKGLKIKGSSKTDNISSNLVLTTTGFTQLENLTALDIDATSATNVKVFDVEADNVTG